MNQLKGTEIRKNIRIGDLQLEYVIYGNVGDIVICLHGHGRTPADFKFIATENRKVISIQLFHHGNSFFPEERIERNPLKTIEFIELFKEILKREKVSKFHLFAFSQGGRFSLCLIPYLAEKIQTITLIAPDGMNNNSFYNWTSRQQWARKLFIRFENNPSRLIRLSSFASKIKLMRPKVKVFVHEFASNKETIKRASITWRSFRNVMPDTQAISNTIKKHAIPFLIIMGSHDQVIRPKQAYSFAEKLKITDCVKEVPNGHNFFKKTSIEKFIHLLPFIQKKAQ